jgi:hypothetical protein
MLDMVPFTAFRVTIRRANAPQAPLGAGWLCVGGAG